MASEYTTLNILTGHFSKYPPGVCSNTLNIFMVIDLYNICVGIIKNMLTPFFVVHFFFFFACCF